MFLIFQVYDYLEQTAACNQTRQVIGELMGKCKCIKLEKCECIKPKQCECIKLEGDEIVNIINIRPSSLVELYPVILKR